ncbi:MAG TPA: cell division protein FtsL [Gammaproteobacteria bacterium]|nr:cell division protein FtsL [Gammaproteobacteria bacterium]
MHKLAIAGPFSGIMITKQLVICGMLGVLVLAQALGVIYVKQNKRLLNATLQNLYTVRDKLHVEWSQLLLEQGTWEADARVERMARDQLGMVVPDKVNVVVPRN